MIREADLSLIKGKDGGLRGNLLSEGGSEHGGDAMGGLHVHFDLLCLDLEDHVSLVLFSQRIPGFNQEKGI